MEKEIIEITKEEFHLIKKFYPPFKRADLLNTNKFIIDWNNLMPVVEKINRTKYDEKYCFSVYIYNSSCHINNPSDIHVETIVRDRGLIGCVWDAVVELIKWYNENNKQ